MVAAILWLLDIRPKEQTGEAWLELDPAARRQKTIDAVKALILSLSKIHPLILLIEDLHWIDVESQSVIHALLAMLSHSRIFLMVTYRPEYEDDWEGTEFCSLIKVDPLTPTIMEAVALDLLGHDPALLTVKQKLIDLTEGNPFFLEESVQSLVEARVLIGRRGSYRLVGSIHQMSVPSSIKSVLAARIDRLSRENKALLQAAAVVGKDVPTDVLALVTGRSSRDLEEGLDSLEKGEFLVETRVSPKEFTFKHALTHDVAYAGLCKSAENFCIQRRFLQWNKSIRIG